MIDLHNHEHIEGWGIRPELFHIGSYTVQSYAFFVSLGIILGIIITFFYTRNKDKYKHEYLFEIVLFGILGGIVGAKIPIWIYYFPEIINNFQGNIGIIISGRTIVGGLIGGTLAVFYIKNKIGIKYRLGNNIVPGIIAGIGIGRVGCYLRGCCYGVQTKLPWGVDFGDGVSRHPTQIYEIVFLLLMFVVINIKLRNNSKDGELFDMFMIYYFSYRFFIEFIRVEPRIFFNLTLFQLLSFCIIIYFVFIKKRIAKCFLA